MNCALWKWIISLVSHSTWIVVAIQLWFWVVIGEQILLVPPNKPMRYIHNFLGETIFRTMILVWLNLYFMLIVKFSTSIFDQLKFLISIYNHVSELNFDLFILLWNVMVSICTIEQVPCLGMTKKKLTVFEILFIRIQTWTIQMIMYFQSIMLEWYS